MKTVIATLIVLLAAVSCSPCWDDTSGKGMECGSKCLTDGTTCCDPVAGISCTSDQRCVDNANCEYVPSTGTAPTSTGGSGGSSDCRGNADATTCLVLENQCSNKIAGACSCAAACVDAACGDANQDAEKLSGDSARAQGFACPY